MAEGGNGLRAIDDRNNIPKVKTKYIKIPSNILVARLIFILNEIESLLTTYLPFSNLITSKCIMLCESSKGIVNIVIESRGAVADSPS